MTWTKLDDGIFDHPKMLRAGEDAANLYVRALVWCNKHLTDGAIPREALRVLTSRRDAASLADKLVAVGLWSSAEDGWSVHGFSDHNPTREQVEARRSELSAKRAEAGKRGGLRSGEVRRDEANAKQVASTDAKQNATPVPSRPDQTSQKGETSSLLSPQPSAAPTAPALALEPEQPKPAKARRPKPDRPPPPFTADEAVGALAAASGGRFVAGERSTWPKGWVIALHAAVRRHGALSTWRLVGEWLASGHAGHPSQTWGVQWAASNALTDAVAKAEAWDAAGRPERAGWTPARPLRDEGPDPWATAKWVTT